MYLSNSRFNRRAGLSILYFIQGIPQGLVYFALLDWLASVGFGISDIAIVMSLASLPWTFKILLGPFVDTLKSSKMGKRKPWIFFSLLISSLVFFVSSNYISNELSAISIGLSLFTVILFTSILDVATDGLAIDTLNDDERGLYVDSLLTDHGAISIVFSFSRSYFFITTDYPSAIVEYLKELLPGKTRAVLYSAIGLHKQGKTLLYRHFLKYSKITSEKLIIAPGIKGMVMSVFTFPMYPYVFKVINDRFAPPKMGTKEMVKDRYYFVKNHVRIGRLADTWEFSNVAFPLKDIDDTLLQELKKKAASNIEIEDDLLIVKHMYIENKMTPLNIYLETANKKQQNHIINDYGKAIDELINSNIFPGDMLTKNFGVTRQNRVVFYDYDEITLMSTPIFKKIPKAKTYEQEMASEPWYYVGQNDVFPEEFKYFILPDPYMKEVFNKKYKKLLDADYWVSVQEKIKQNGVMDYYPYGLDKRMCEIYPEK